MATPNVAELWHAYLEHLQVELLLECFDAYRALGILDKAWRLLMEILDARSIPRTVLKKVNNHAFHYSALNVNSSCLCGKLELDHP